MPHIVLLGDSIFDNGAYTAGAPDVVAHLRSLLPPGWKGSLAAVDGATTGRLRAQFARIPDDATHLVVAIGGNDALQNSDLLSTRVGSSAETLALFADRLNAFEASYGAALDGVVALQRHTVVCTIYNGALSPEQAAIARVGLMMFNDAIVRTAVARGLDVIELRSICTDPGDYANPIEPSGQGGRKIAHAIARAVGAVGGGTASRIFGAESRRPWR
jgi:hypothetical protein